LSNLNTCGYYKIPCPWAGSISDVCNVEADRDCDLYRQDYIKRNPDEYLKALKLRGIEIEKKGVETKIPEPVH
jgi:hypothetical protein